MASETPKKSNIRDIFLRRIDKVSLFFVLITLGIIGKGIYTAVFDRAFWLNLESQRNIRTVEKIATRGNIILEDGTYVLTSIPNYNVFFHFNISRFSKQPTFFRDSLEKTCLGLNAIFQDKTALEYEQLFKENQRKYKDSNRKHHQYFLLKRNVSYFELKKMNQLPLFKQSPKYATPLNIEQINKRERPFGMLALRTIGIARSSMPVGIEASFDTVLAGKNSQVKQQKIAPNLWSPIKDANYMPAIDGKDVCLTLDMQLQDITHNALLKGLQTHKADYGCVLVMETKTGKIKAIANLGLDKNNQYTENFNYAIGERIEPGSTFKLMSIMAALELKGITFNEVVNVAGGRQKVGGMVVTDYETSPKAVITLQEAFEKSSNIGISKIIYSKFYNRQAEFVEQLKRFNLNYRTKIELNGEKPPFFYSPTRKEWQKTVTPVAMSYGYGVVLTPLQILMFYNAVANDGKVVRPYLVAGVSQYGQWIYRKKSDVINPKLCSDATLKQAQKLLEGVVERGTAQSLKNNYFKIAGKTGTARIAGKLVNGRIGKNDESMHRALFVGYFPADNPQYSCIVVITDPKGTHYTGGYVAAPVFKEIAEKIYASRIAPIQNTIANTTIADSTNKSISFKGGNAQQAHKILEHLNITHNKVLTGIVSPTLQRQTNAISLTKLNNAANTMPDIVGMGLRDALYILGNKGLKVSVLGKGTVKKQSIAAGQLLTGIKFCSIELE